MRAQLENQRRIFPGAAGLDEKFLPSIRREQVRTFGRRLFFYQRVLKHSVTVVTLDGARACDHLAADLLGQLGCESF